jgi:tetratricopeptide (TPR) repeat protein
MHQEGDELVQKRMYNEAIEKYKASIQREASFLESYIKWGRILLTQGKPQEAIAVAERGEARAKQAKNQIKGEFKWLKLHCYLSMGKFEEALSEFADASPLLDQSFKQRIDYRETNRPR